MTKALGSRPLNSPSNKPPVTGASEGWGAGGRCRVQKARVLQMGVISAHLLKWMFPECLLCVRHDPGHGAANTDFAPYGVGVFWSHSFNWGSESSVQEGRGSGSVQSQAQAFFPPLGDRGAGADAVGAVGSGHLGPLRTGGATFIPWPNRSPDQRNGDLGVSPPSPRKSHAVTPNSFWLMWLWAEGQDSWPRTC